MSDSIKLQRSFSAPRALVFEVWSKPEHFMRWFAPNHFDIPRCEMDFRVGGSFRAVMRGMGMEHGFGGTYVEIVPNERIRWVGRIDGLDQDMTTTVTFADDGKKTLVTVEQTVPNNPMMAAGQREGWGQTLDHLGEHAEGLADGTRMFFERSFDAPRALMWSAWTEAPRFARWFGPHGATMEIVAFEPKTGGAIHFCHRMDGAEVWIKGRYDEVIAKERIAFTMGFVDPRGTPIAHPMVPGWPADATITSHVTLSDDGPRTRVRIVQTIATADAGAREAIRVHNGMAKEGWAQTLDRLAAVLS